MPRDPITGDPATSAGARRREFLRSHGAAVATGALAVVGLVVAALLLTGDGPPVVPKTPELTIVSIVEPPPPPPPEPPRPEMIEQPAVTEPEFEPPQLRDEPPPVIDDDPPPEVAADEPPDGPLGLDAVAEGPGDAFNLIGRPGGSGLLSGAGGGGSRWGWYAYMVQRALQRALAEHDRTRNAATRIELRLWIDDDGRIIRVALNAPTGDRDVDEAIENDVLIGLQLTEPPPTDMPMPIVARLMATQPGSS